MCPFLIHSTHSSQSGLSNTQITLFPSCSHVPRLPITNRIEFKLLKCHPSLILASFPYIPFPSEHPPDTLTTWDLLRFPMKPYPFMPLGHFTHCHLPWNFFLSCAHVQILPPPFHHVSASYVSQTLVSAFTAARPG